MKAKTKLITAISIGMIMSGSLLAQVNTAKTESNERKTLRHKRVQLRIDRIKLARKYGRISTAKATFVIKRIKFFNQFKDDNPEWVSYSRRWRRGGRRWRGRGRGGMYGRRRGAMRGWRRKVVTEPVTMKQIRHKRAEIRIMKVSFAAKKGFISQARANFKIKKIKAMQRFKDNNPEWVRYKRRGRHGRGRRRHGRRFRRGCGR